MGRLTTHILDTTRGGAAQGVELRLYRCGEQREQIAAATSNADGRTDKALLADDTMLTGTSEIEFDIGE